jgi:hypothetical protein
VRNEGGLLELTAFGFADTVARPYNLRHLRALPLHTQSRHSPAYLI